MRFLPRYFRFNIVIEGSFFALFLSWLWFCRGIVKAFFTDNCSVKKLIILSFFEISFSTWEILFLNKSNTKQSPLLLTPIKSHCCRWQEVATCLLVVFIPSGCRGAMSTSLKVFRSIGWAGVVFVNSSFVNLLSTTARNYFIFSILAQIQSNFSFTAFGSNLNVSIVVQSFSLFCCMLFFSVLSLPSILSGD